MNNKQALIFVVLTVVIAIAIFGSMYIANVVLA
jgi:hypothetical protein